MDISQITPHLYIAAHPKTNDYDRLKNLKPGLVISMIFHPPSIKFYKLQSKFLLLPSFDSPHLPISIKKLHRGVITALPVIKRNQNVLVYCREGKHRSVAMTACILIGDGHSVKSAIKLIKHKRPVAEPNTWYIKKQIEKYRDYWEQYGQKIIG